MTVETKTCQNCKTSFIIEPEDFGFYEKIGVPPPTWCPECWWSDAWDAVDYGTDVDFSKPFLRQFKELQNIVPKSATWKHNSVDCQYCITEIDSKRCYFCYGPFRSEDCMYGTGPIMSKQCVDSDAGMNMSESYGCYNSDSIYRCKFANSSEECMNSSFLFDCSGCSNCFGCVNLRHKQYCLFNQQLTKQEYQKQMECWDLGSYARIQEAQEKFSNLYYSVPHRYAQIINSPNCTGDNIKNSKNCKNCFTALGGIENGKFIFLSGLMLKDSYDVNVGGLSSQGLYECTSSETHCESVYFTKGGKECMRIEYCESCINSKDLFGCTQMRNKQYCILNKQYSKEEYTILRKKIIEQMKEYGEFFPPSMSPWPYNESFAYDQFPLKKEEALARGYAWHDSEKRNYATTISAANLPDHIRDVPDSITKEIISCGHSGRNCEHLCSAAFRIIPEELAFYRHMNIALPRLCPNCRYYQRIKWRTPAKLWHRKCTKPECPNEFETAYGPDRKEIIYCDSCYKAEFL